MDIDALIPARGGSKRIPGKNMKLLNGMPLVYWTIKAAKEAGIFRRVVVSTEDAEIKEFCEQYCEVVDRPVEFAADDSPDIEWVSHFLSNYTHSDDFMVLRPTSPFRTVSSICDAESYYDNGYTSSVRTVTAVSQHPLKTWMFAGGKYFIKPFVDYGKINGHEPHTLPYCNLPLLFIQTGSIEVSNINNVFDLKDISGATVGPLFSFGPEAHDLNTPEDWVIAEWYLKEGMVTL